MPVSVDRLLAECQRLENTLRDIEQRSISPNAEILSACEQELTEIASSLEELRTSVASDSKSVADLRSNPVLRRALHQIRKMGGELNIRFLHGSNYCAGLLQAALSTGYSRTGLPVLAPSQSRNSFEG